MERCFACKKARKKWTNQRQSCLAWRLVQKVLIGLSPLYQARDQWGLHVAHTCHLVHKNNIASSMYNCQLTTESILTLHSYHNGKSKHQIYFIENDITAISIFVDSTEHLIQAGTDVIVSSAGTRSSSRATSLTKSWSENECRPLMLYRVLITSNHSLLIQSDMQYCTNIWPLSTEWLPSFWYYT